MRLKFLGAAQMVTGSSYFLSTSRTGVLVDLGMFQGKSEEVGLNAIRPDFDWGKLTAVVITHAHLDHCGRLPMLELFGYHGPIYMTESTKALAELVLYDSAKIAKEEEAKSILYTDEEVEKVLNRVRVIEYGKEFAIGDFKVIFYDAGHILGSASVLFEDKRTGKRIVFSGDLGNTPEPLIYPTHPIERADFAVMESTYGDELHGERNEKKMLAEIVELAQKEKGTVLIPSFSIERAQELLYIFDQLKKEGVVNNDLPVFLDSPMAIKATQVFRDFPELYSKRLREQVKTDDPFDFPNLVMCDTIEKSRQIKNYEGAKVIIAGSGMMNGGRIIHHVINHLGQENTQLVFVGFQAEGTLGRKIKDGLRILNIWGNTIEVKARLREIKSMSSHADQGQLVSWLTKINGLKEVILTHGEELPRLVLSEKIRQELPGIKVVLPSLHQEIEIKVK